MSLVCRISDDELLKLRSLFDAECLTQLAYESMGKFGAESRSQIGLVFGSTSITQVVLPGSFGINKSRNSMTTEILTLSDLDDDELRSRWRYGVRQREMLSVLNEVFDQFVPLTDDDDGLEFNDGSRATAIAAPHVGSFA